MNWNNITSARVKIEYANMSKINKIRAWARKHQATVQVNRYAKDAYEGYVSIPCTHGIENQSQLIAEVKALL